MMTAAHPFFARHSKTNVCLEAVTCNPPFCEQRNLYGALLHHAKRTFASNRPTTRTHDFAASPPFSTAFSGAEVANKLSVTAVGMESRSNADELISSFTPGMPLS